MSIYSGFPTRKDEHSYNKLVSKLLMLLQDHLFEFISPKTISEDKIISYSRIMAKMKLYEEHKYLPPKFTDFMKPLAHICGISQVNTTQNHIHDLESQSQSRALLLNRQKEVTSSANDQRKKAQSQFKTAYRYDNHSSKKESVVIVKPDSHRKTPAVQDSFYDFHEKRINKLTQKFTKKMQSPSSQNQANHRMPSETEKVTYNSHSIIQAKKHLNKMKFKAIGHLKQINGGLEKKQSSHLLRQEMRKKLKTQINCRN